jgi:hypothetical protein
LLCALFEDLGCAIELHAKIANEDTALHSLDPRNYLFNGQEEGDYLFGQGIINEASFDNKEYLQLYESWCLFAYREFYKNLLVILDEVSLRTFGGKTSIPNRFCKLFDLHDDGMICHTRSTHQRGIIIPQCMIMNWLLFMSLKCCNNYSM